MVSRKSRVMWEKLSRWKTSKDVAFWVTCRGQIANAGTPATV